MAVKGKSPVGTNGASPFPPGSVEEKINRIFRKLPETVLRKLPKDGASNHDYYLYGLPKRKR